MKELYVVIDDKDSPADVHIEHLTVKSVYDPHEGVPDEPCRVLPPLEACVDYNGEDRRVILGVDASEDLNIALRLAFRKLDRYMGDASSRIIESQRRWIYNPDSLSLSTEMARKILDYINMLEDAKKAVSHFYVCTWDFLNPKK